MSAPSRSSGSSTVPVRLRAHGVGVVLGDAEILREVDLEVAGGELVALVGPNGAGKSTLLSALAGDLDLDTGEVLLDGHDARRVRPRDLARSRSVLPQQGRLAFGFAVREVVAMGRAPWARTEREDHDEAVVEASMVRTEVTHLSTRSYPTLSGGERARTDLARVLAQDTEVVLLDEPTAALDIKHQEAVLAVARDLARAGRAVVVVLHDLSLAAGYADRVCVLSGGRVRADGTPREVLTDDLLTEVYQHPVQVVDVAGSLVVVPVREPAGAPVGGEVPCVG